jgi:tetratricopeptide (TPR) repeat protein
VSQDSRSPLVGLQLQAGTSFARPEKFGTRFVAMLVLLCGLTAFGGAQNAPRSVSPKVASDDVSRAADLYRQGKMLDALPLYEALVLKFPNEPVYEERLGACFLAKSSTVSSPVERRELLVRAHQHGLNAQRLGDHSDYLGILLGIDPDHPTDFATLDSGEAGRLLKEGEAAFSRGDYSAAFTAYSRAAAANPHLYEAALFVGDTAFAQRDPDKAGEWFAKAIAIDPNRETAYRYWGDALEAGSKPLEARAKFVEAVIAEPYNQIAWSGLIQWAPRHKSMLQAPEIQRPPAPTVDPANGKTVTISPNHAGKDDPASSAWLAYSLTRAAWRSETFAKTFPKATEYRHTLQEEAAALHAVVVAVEEQKIAAGKLDSSLSSLVELDKAGMLDSWILITGADGSIAKDYRPYREEHRDLLRTYIEHYIIHDNPGAPH